MDFFFSEGHERHAIAALRDEISSILVYGEV
jgi:hypothetical protein